jgi:hypothetical protein
MYTSVNGTISYSSSYARFSPPAGLSGQGIKFASNGAWIVKTLQNNEATFICKVALNFAGLGVFPNNPFLGILDSGSYQWQLCITPSGALSVLNGGGATQVTSGVGLISTGAWYGIEIEVTISSSAGTAQVWVNGAQVINASGLNTQRTGNAYGQQVGLGDINDNGLVNLQADDLRVWDNTGTTQNAPLGTDSRLLQSLPDGAGAFSQFTPNGAAANWQCVDDNPPDGDTTYVSGSSSGLQDAYDMPSPGMTVAPVMVVARSYVRKDDSATRSLEIGVYSGGTAGTGGSVVVGSSYQFIDACIPLNPDGNVAWTAAAANAAQHYKYETA